MPIRTASVTNRLAANGQALHRAMQRRLAAGGADAAPSEAEAALLEERRALKEEREQRRAQALQPRPSALDRLLRTHHPEPKHREGKKEGHDGQAVKKPKARRTRAEKHAEQAAAIEAARHSRSAAKKPGAK